jgi:hypothetical protein
VRPLLVVVPDIGTQNPKQMPPPEHQRPVKTLRTLDGVATLGLDETNFLIRRLLLTAAEQRTERGRVRLDG